MSTVCWYKKAFFSFLHLFFLSFKPLTRDHIELHKYEFAFSLNFISQYYLFCFIIVAHTYNIFIWLNQTLSKMTCCVPYRALNEITSDPQLWRSFFVRAGGKLTDAAPTDWRTFTSQWLQRRSWETGKFEFYRSDGTHACIIVCGVHVAYMCMLVWADAGDVDWRAVISQ